MNEIKITTLTPVHIGSGRELARDIEFVEMNKNIGVIDEKKTLDIIGAENIGTWVAKIENQEPLLLYLKNIKNDVKLSEVCKYTMPLFSNNFKAIKTLKEQLHDGMGRPLIPGSSIKGAIRTVLMNLFLYQLNRNWNEYELKNMRGNFSDKTVQSRFFGKDPNHDIMRFVKIGDAIFSNHDLSAQSVLSLNYLFNRTTRDQKFLQLVESIGIGSNANLRMKIDLSHWKKNIDYKEFNPKIPEFLNDLPSLFKALNQFTAKLLQEEIDFWEEDKNLAPVEDYILECEKLLNESKKCTVGKETVLRVGHGSGWLFMTGGWIKNPDFVNDEGENNLYDKIIDKTRPNNYRYKNHFFPKTRRMNEDGGLMGFVKLAIA